MKSALLVALGLGVALTAVSPLTAQSSRFRGQSLERPNYDEVNVEYDGRFTFVRVRFTPLNDSWGRPGDLKWDHDYPRAERHLVRILDEITDVSPLVSGSNILALDDPELFKYPVAYLSEPGYWTLTEDEADGLRNYLLKGGFLIVDDFVGSQWYNFEAAMREVLPDSRLVELDVSHPIFHSFFDIDALDHVHPYYRGYVSVFYGVYEDNDPNKRLLVIANYNNDIGESWEWSDTGFLPIELSNEAYKLGVNYIVYAMTH